MTTSLLSVALPLSACAWASHAETTIKDASGNVVAECGGHGWRSADSEAIAAQIVIACNSNYDLLALASRVTGLNHAAGEIGAGMLAQLVDAARAAIAQSAGGAALTQRRTKTPDLLRALRNWHPTHDEALDVFACLASSIKHGQSPLGDKCRDTVVDYCDESFAQIENDQIDKQAAQAWQDNERRAA